MAQFGEDIFGDDFGLPVFTPAPFGMSGFDDVAETLPMVRTPLTPWPAKLPFELAIGGEPLIQTLDRHNCTEDDYARWALMPAFRRALSEAMKEMNEQGLPFKRVCAEIAKDFLTVIDQKLHDPDVGFALKMDTFKHIAKLGGLEPVQAKEAVTSGNMVNIQINL